MVVCVLGLRGLALKLATESHIVHQSLRFIIAALFALAYGSVALAGKTRNVVLIVCDGLRPEEIFRGAELELINKSDMGNW